MAFEPKWLEPFFPRTIHCRAGRRLPLEPMATPSKRTKQQDLINELKRAPDVYAHYTRFEPHDREIFAPPSAKGILCAE